MNNGPAQLLLLTRLATRACRPHCRLVRRPPTTILQRCNSTLPPSSPSVPPPPPQQQRQWSTPLAKTITDAINVTGPISIAAFMRQCLTSPDGGYYTSRGKDSAGTEVFGRKGDFITSPEISQIFGELLGVWTVAEWIAQGRRKTGVEIIEVGPGKGTLMADMLRSFRNFKTFANSIEAVYLVEASPVLRDVQKQLLCGDAPMEEVDIGYKSTSTHLGVPVIWTEHIRFLPQGEDKTPFIFAHEFFDALPIHAFQSVAPDPSQTIMTPTGPTALHHTTPASTPQWRELVVSPNPESESKKEPEFRLSIAKASTPNSLVIPEISPRYKALKDTPGSTIEVSPESQSWVQEFARRIGGPNPPRSDAKTTATTTPTQTPTQRQPSGAALILDYGTMSTIPINSLRGIQKHKLVSPFTAPGEVDLSADVDFTALAEAAIEASPGVEVYGPMEQGDLLQTLGIEERAKQLLRKEVGDGDEERRRTIESGWKRLVERGGGGMGKIYKAMAIVPESGGKRRPVGFGGGIRM
ncbi:hypothetical protein AJ80_08511 [Polytolypa hystricis UAMH7299]|uniref:Protein arginine methyltransferase NDUFAF7 n=1 Tax=Polytolypa hystricis (strain UAMH7299) TaxID=1447883 RepID=A0A2B7X725_POLH7|nr:hypothetical protein AJ80_08511 [Polytolypa hystricis UAMH7299]